MTVMSTLMKNGNVLNTVYARMETSSFLFTCNLCQTHHLHVIVTPQRLASLGSINSACSEVVKGLNKFLMISADVFPFSTKQYTCTITK